MRKGKSQGSGPVQSSANPQPPKIPGIPLLIFLIPALAIAAIGWWVYGKEKAHTRQAADETLNIIANLKVGQIVNWRRERLADAATISQNPFNTLRIIPFLRNPRPGDTGADIRAWLETLQKNYHYYDILLLDAQGRERLVAGFPEIELSPLTQAQVAEVLRTGEPKFADFYWSKAHGRVLISLFVPLIDSRDRPEAPRCAGVLLLRIDPCIFFYPLIQLWPTPSLTAETLLVRLEGEEVLLLNELRHRKNTALTLRLPSSDLKLPAAMAAGGLEGINEGRDYRGLEVFTAIRRVPDSPWFMIAKVDQKEILTPFATRVMVIFVVTGSLILIMGMAMVWWEKRREVVFYHGQYEAELALRESERRFRDLVETISDLVWEVDVQGAYSYVSPRVKELLGYEPEELLGRTPFDLMPPEEAQRIGKIFRDLVAARQPISSLEYVNLRKDGSMVVLETSGLPLLDAAGHLMGYRGVGRDITARKLAEKQIKNSLREKEVLLREIYHRVKNNLQVISSLLSLQARTIADKKAAANFLESQGRIDSMALIHEKLYGSEDLARISFIDYVPELARNLFISYGADAGRIKLKITVTEVSLGIDTAIPLGLIINELVSNCLKHAFPADAPCGRPGEPECEIRVDLRPSGDGRYLLTVSDNGVGAPKEIDFHNSKTLGMKLVNTLVEQLDGTIDLESGIGTQVKITFTELKYRARG